jgi:hypothetical protein
MVVLALYIFCVFPVSESNGTGVLSAWRADFAVYELRQGEGEVSGGGAGIWRGHDARAQRAICPWHEIVSHQDSPSYGLTEQNGTMLLDLGIPAYNSMSFAAAMAHTPSRGGTNLGRLA